MNFIRTSLLGLLALPLAAQSSGISVGGSIIWAPTGYFDSYQKVVNNRTGFALNAAFDTNIHNTDVATRISAEVAFMPGKTTQYGLKTSLNLYQVSGDVFLDTPLPALRGLVGLSLNYWSLSTSGVESWAPSDANHHFPLETVKGLKLGYRLGLDYAFTKSLSGQLLMQQTELSGKARNDNFVRRGGINPAWLELGVRFKF